MQAKGGAGWPNHLPIGHSNVMGGGPLRGGAEGLPLVATTALQEMHSKSFAHIRAGAHLAQTQEELCHRRSQGALPSSVGNRLQGGRELARLSAQGGSGGAAQDSTQREDGRQLHCRRRRRATAKRAELRRHVEYGARWRQARRQLESRCPGVQAAQQQKSHHPDVAIGMAQPTWP